MSNIKCRVCNKDNPEHIFYCEEHYKCQGCGTKDDLFMSEKLLCDGCHKKRIEKNIKNFDGDTEMTNEIICPHCGYEHTDSWEFSEGEHNCDDCELPFEIERIVTVEYTTTKVEQSA